MISSIQTDICLSHLTVHITTKGFAEFDKSKSTNRAMLENFPNYLLGWYSDLRPLQDFFVHFANGLTLHDPLALMDSEANQSVVIA